MTAEKKKTHSGSDKRQRDHVIGVRVSSAELELVRAEAGRAGVSDAAVLRDLAVLMLADQVPPTWPDHCEYMVIPLRKEWRLPLRWQHALKLIARELAKITDEEIDSYEGYKVQPYINGRLVPAGKHQEK
jgi:hypothetical protein